MVRNIQNNRVNNGHRALPLRSDRIVGIGARSVLNEGNATVALGRFQQQLQGLALIGNRQIRQQRLVGMTSQLVDHLVAANVLDRHDGTSWKTMVKSSFADETVQTQRGVASWAKSFHKAGKLSQRQVQELMNKDAITAFGELYSLALTNNYEGKKRAVRAFESIGLSNNEIGTLMHIGNKMGYTTKGGSDEVWEERAEEVQRGGGCKVTETEDEKECKSLFEQLVEKVEEEAGSWGGKRKRIPRDKALALVIAHIDHIGEHNNQISASWGRDTEGLEILRNGLIASVLGARGDSLVREQQQLMFIASEKVPKVIMVAKAVATILSSFEKDGLPVTNKEQSEHNRDIHITWQKRFPEESRSKLTQDQVVHTSGGSGDDIVEVNRQQPTVEIEQHNVQEQEIQKKRETEEQFVQERQVSIQEESLLLMQQWAERVIGNKAEQHKENEEQPIAIDNRKEKKDEEEKTKVLVESKTVTQAIINVPTVIPLHETEQETSIPIPQQNFNTKTIDSVFQILKKERKLTFSTVEEEKRIVVGKSEYVPISQLPTRQDSIERAIVRLQTGYDSPGVKQEVECVKKGDHSGQETIVLIQPVKKKDQIRETRPLPEQKKQVVKQEKKIEIIPAKRDELIVSVQPSRKNLTKVSIEQSKMATLSKLEQRPLAKFLIQKTVFQQVITLICPAETMIVSLPLKKSCRTHQGTRGVEKAGITQQQVTTEQLSHKDINKPKEVRVDVKKREGNRTQSLEVVKKQEKEVVEEVKQQRAEIKRDFVLLSPQKRQMIVVKKQEQNSHEVLQQPTQKSQQINHEEVVVVRTERVTNPVCGVKTPIEEEQQQEQKNELDRAVKTTERKKEEKILIQKKAKTGGHHRNRNDPVKHEKKAVVVERRKRTLKKRQEKVVHQIDQGKENLVVPIVQQKEGGIIQKRGEHGRTSEKEKNGVKQDQIKREVGGMQCKVIRSITGDRGKSFIERLRTEYFSNIKKRIEKLLNANNQKEIKQPTVKRVFDQTAKRIDRVNNMKRGKLKEYVKDTHLQLQRNTKKTDALEKKKEQVKFVLQRWQKERKIQGLRGAIVLILRYTRLTRFARKIERRYERKLKERLQRIELHIKITKEKNKLLSRYFNALSKLAHTRQILNETIRDLPNKRKKKAKKVEKKLFSLRLQLLRHEKNIEETKLNQQEKPARMRRIIDKFLDTTARSMTKVKWKPLRRISKKIRSICLFFKRDKMLKRKKRTFEKKIHKVKEQVVKREAVLARLLKTPKKKAEMALREDKTNKKHTSEAISFPQEKTRQIEVNNQKEISLTPDKRSVVENCLAIVKSHEKKLRESTNFPEKDLKKIVDEVFDVFEVFVQEIVLDSQKKTLFLQREEVTFLTIVLWQSLLVEKSLFDYRTFLKKKRIKREMAVILLRELYEKKLLKELKISYKNIFSGATEDNVRILAWLRKLLHLHGVRDVDQWILQFLLRLEGLPSTVPGILAAIGLQDQFDPIMYDYAPEQQTNNLYCNTMH